MVRCDNFIESINNRSGTPGVRKRKNNGEDEALKYAIKQN